MHQQTDTQERNKKVLISYLSFAPAFTQRQDRLLNKIKRYLAKKVYSLLELISKNYP